VSAKDSINFAFQADKDARILQKNIIMMCGDMYSYHDFICSKSNYCEAKIVNKFDDLMSILTLFVDWCKSS